MNGVSLVAPAKIPTQTPTGHIREVGANWVAIMPYAFVSVQNPKVNYDVSWQWWGEKTAGVKQCIEWCRQDSLKVLIKPHVWVKEQGWNGDFKLESENQWNIWEASYLDYIVHYAKIAQSTKAQGFCIGVELRQVVRNRPEFFERLIDSVRVHYQGPLTYAANWDNYSQVSFWNRLDYIGIDAYFPLSEANSPTTAVLMESWAPIKEAIRSLSESMNKPVIFTEYGYRSMDKAAGKHWELPDDWNYDGDSNENVQLAAYEALYKTFWKEDWFAGGFCWKWYCDHKNAGGPNNTDFTPQNKRAESAMRSSYIKP